MSTVENSIYLHGVALANFRGIGDEVEQIGPFGRFNFFIGPNNSGKSSVLIFIAKYLSDVINKGRPNLAYLDVPIQKNKAAVRMGFGIPKTTILDNIASKLEQISDRKYLLHYVERILGSIAQDDLLWVQRNEAQLEGINFDIRSPNVPFELVSADAWRELWSVLTNQSGGGLQRHWIPETMSTILNAGITPMPQISLIPAIREISPKGQEFTDLTGTGLIEELARLQNPGFSEREKSEKFKKINKFLQSVTENNSALIEIPFDREHVLIHMDEKVLPLESLGTGIHEVVMLAAFCTLIENQIVCIEEPEIHLHPVLQRRLIRYLQENTTNQYFVATHSPGIIDMPGAAVFHVTNINGRTKIAGALTPNSKFAICRDLGYKASDLLQANAIIWVEGPSDRIYIRHWISLIAPSLREGTDYSIMFYGGRLLSHLSAEDPNDATDDINALITVRQLNRNLAVVIDSDKPKKTAQVNATKSRIIDELASHGGICWLTEGREIENYIPSEIMFEALKEVYRGKFKTRLKTEKFDHVLPFRTQADEIFKDVDKVKVAKAACKRITDIAIFDLHDRITDIVNMIENANR